MALPSETAAPTLALPLTCRPSHDTFLEGFWRIHDANGRMAATLPGTPDVGLRAKQIVQACNREPAVAELERALRACITCLQYVDRVHPKLTGLADRLDCIAASRSALERVEGANG